MESQFERNQKAFHKNQGINPETGRKITIGLKKHQELVAKYGLPIVREMFTINLGSFQQISSQILVSDPAYDYDPREHVPNSGLIKLNLIINNVMTGNWNANVNRFTDEKTSNAELVCMHNSINTVNNWIHIGDIGVDSGQAGIYDLKYFPKEEGKNKDQWYDLNSKTTVKPNYAGIIPHGVVSLSGFGDGIYDVYIVKNPKVVAIKIVFIGEEYFD